MNIYELNLDGLVGPTHHYAGLSIGNIASTTNALSIANPQAAALQGLDKMRLLHQLGLKQAVMPPQIRPNLDLLRQLGFSGQPAAIVRKAKREAPDLLSACYSASSMWTANAATVAPSSDTTDGRVHFTAANLITNLHRHQEARSSQLLLQQLFNHERYFQHHAPLPSTLVVRDEGAANHTRLCQKHDAQGIHLFVYNQQMLPTSHHSPKPTRYPARQTLEASQAIARHHLLNPERVVFALQHPDVVDSGVFHNDVIAVGNESILLVHEDAFYHQRDVLDRIRAISDDAIQMIEVKREQISVADAVNSYLFNAQLITLPDQTMALIAPAECESMPAIKHWIDDTIAAKDNPISSVYYLDLKQSMRNGGGPACLRLRIVLNETELQAMHQGVLINDALLGQLEAWIRQHYRTELQFNDLDDPALMVETELAFDELYKLLQLNVLNRHFL